MSLEKIQIRIAPDFILDLQKLAAYDNRSMSNYIAKILKDHVRTMRPVLARINSESGE